MTSKGPRLEPTINSCNGNLTSRCKLCSAPAIDETSKIVAPKRSLIISRGMPLRLVIGEPLAPSSIVNERALASEVERAVSEEVFPTMVFDPRPLPIALFAMMVTLVVVAVIGISSM